MTFTKLFASITESTVWCENDQVRIVWITMLAMANQNGKVFGSIPGLANRARVPIPAVEEALGKFMAPDPYSRSKDFEGRRIVEIDGGWQLLTYAKHRDRRSDEERREYMRDYMRRKRSPLTNVSNVNSVSHPLAKADADADKEESKSKSMAHFVRPTIEQVAAYCLHRNNQIDPSKFLDFYESKGWYVGKNKMKDWRAAVRNWERNNYGGPFHDGYQENGRNVGQRLGTQAQRAVNNSRAFAAALGWNSAPDSPRQAPRLSSGDAPTLDGEAEDIPGTDDL